MYLELTHTREKKWLPVTAGNSLQQFVVTWMLETLASNVMDDNLDTTSTEMFFSVTYRSSSDRLFTNDTPIPSFKVTDNWERKKYRNKFKYFASVFNTIECSCLWNLCDWSPIYRINGWHISLQSNNILKKILQEFSYTEFLNRMWNKTNLSNKSMHKSSKRNRFFQYAVQITTKMVENAP